jgi:3'-phosphoadenosine 5'-phosphosulfate sulfotransferase (PAPS reductase)/FAD synthetase
MQSKNTISNLLYDDIQSVSEQKARRQMLLTGNTRTYGEKVRYAKGKIREFYHYCKTNKLEFPVVSFSGGRDSSILLHMVRKLYPKTPAITATELFNPDNSKLIRETENVHVYAPAMQFDRIIKERGFPMISKELAQKINAVRNCKTNGK